MNHAYYRWSPFLLLLTIMFTGLNADATSSSKPTDLNDLVGELERGCQLSEMLVAFRSDINKRYTFEFLSNRSQNTVRVPKPFTSAIGRAQSYNRGDNTEVVVPLKGVYRGLRTRSITFHMGHSNGINVTTLAFDETRSGVEKVIGFDVAKTQMRFETDPMEGIFGFSVRIADYPNGSVLICNTST